jgi:hypothetical protein
MIKNKVAPNRKKLVLEKLPVMKMTETKEDSKLTAPDAATAIARYSVKSTCETQICA